MTVMDREQRLNELTERLRVALGDTLCRVSLYGSRARGDWRPDSDWDVLVVLSERSLAMEDRVLEVVTDFELDVHYDLCVNVQIVSLDRFESLYSSGYPYWMNMRREEKVLWTRMSN